VKTTLTQHPLSAAFPPMAEPDFEALVADVAENGLQSAVVLHQDQVLDGWHRYRACLSAGVEPRTVDFEGADPVTFVLSMNLNRRHLTASQRAAAVLECSEWRGVGANSAPVRTPTTATLAKLADVSTRTIENAKAAIRKGRLEDLKSGAVTAKAAAKPIAGAAPEPAVIIDPEPEAFDPNAELLEHAAEAMAIINSDDIAKAALQEAIKAKREATAVYALYDALKGEVAAYKREISRWMYKAKASAACPACKASLTEPAKESP
jgi:hypothetical protein